MTRPNALAPAPSASGHTHGQQTGSNPCRLVCLPGPSGACQSRKEAHLAAVNSSRRRARRGVSPGPNAERPAALPLDLVNPAPRTLATRLHRQLLGVPRQPRMASRSPPVIDAACAAVSEAASGDDRIAGTIVAAGSLAWSGATQRGHQGRLRMPPKPAGSGLDYPSEVLRGLHSLHMPRCAGAAGFAGELLGVELVDHLDNVDVLVLQLLEDVLHLFGRDVDRGESLDDLFVGEEAALLARDDESRTSSICGSFALLRMRSQMPSDRATSSCSTTQKGCSHRDTLWSSASISRRRGSSRRNAKTIRRSTARGARPNTSKATGKAFQDTMAFSSSPTIRRTCRPGHRTDYHCEPLGGVLRVRACLCQSARSTDRGRQTASQ